MTTRIAETRRTRARGPVLVAVVALLCLAGLAWRTSFAAEAQPGYHVPQSSGMEAKLGVRFVQAAVLADGGIVELRYTVLDPQKASAFQRDVKHPPVLRSEQRPGAPLYRTALMRQGHDLRPGQSYYILYLNNHRSVRSGETLEITSGQQTLAKVPVR